MTSPLDSIPFQDRLQREKDIARDQLAAAWQIHVAQVEEQLHKGWKENLASLFDERFRLLSEGMEEEFQKRLSVKQAEIRAQALGEAEKVRKDTRQQLASDLNQAVRRLAMAEDPAAWIATLLDALQPLAEHAAFFSLNAGKLRCELARPKAVTIEAEVKSAPAFVNVQETMDTVVSAVSASDLTEQIVRLLELKDGEKVYLLPVTEGAERRLGGVVLLAPAKDSFDLGAAELICTVAGPLRRGPAGKANMVTGIAPAPGAVPRPREVEETDQRAQRFARVKVAEMRLYHSPLVIEGRANKDLYGLLKVEIDRAREQYREEFMTTPGQTDHLDAELVRTLANGDAKLMGADYPGALS